MNTIKIQRVMTPYQWDTCFGITIVYPKDVSCKEVLDFLGKYI